MLGEITLPILNANLEFDEVRWRTTRKASYDSQLSFVGGGRKTLLPAGTKLFRLVPLPNGDYFHGQWWMPEKTFNQLKNQTNRASHGGGRLLRNQIVQGLALPSANQLCVIEIELVANVFGWSGIASGLFDKHGGLEQIFLPNLPRSGDPTFSDHAKISGTFWLKF